MKLGALAYHRADVEVRAAPPDFAFGVKLVHSIASYRLLLVIAIVVLVGSATAFGGSPLGLICAIVGTCIVLALWRGLRVIKRSKNQVYISISKSGDELRYDVFDTTGNLANGWRLSVADYVRFRIHVSLDSPLIKCEKADSKGVIVVEERFWNLSIDHQLGVAWMMSRIGGMDVVLTGAAWSQAERLFHAAS